MKAVKWVGLLLGFSLAVLGCGDIGKETTKRDEP